MPTPNPLEIIVSEATRAGRVVVTHDWRTMPTLLRERALAAIPTAGILVVPKSLPIGAAIDELLLFLLASHNEEWEGLVTRLPL